MPENMGWSFLASVGEQIMETTSSLHVILFRTENNLAGKQYMEMMYW